MGDRGGEQSLPSQEEYYRVVEKIAVFGRTNAKPWYFTFWPRVSEKGATSFHAELEFYITFKAKSSEIVQPGAVKNTRNFQKKEKQW